jgi:hypothetical protein
MKLSALLTAAALALACGCTAETAATAAAGAAIKKQELEEGQRTLEQSKHRVEQVLQAQQRRQSAEP